MQANSTTVSTNQTGIHTDLTAVVRKHLTSEFKQPYKESSTEIFTEIKSRVEKHDGPLILDSGCGTGESTFTLAQQHPKALVIGIDKSKIRITKALEKRQASTSVLLVRIELIDFWRLAVKSNWKLSRHYILYPNPWPKKSHLKRRWHGHAVFPYLLKLGGLLCLRSNWRIYIDEFAAAIQTAAGKNGMVRDIPASEPLSGFERKYGASGQALYEYKVDLAGSKIALK